MDLSVRDAAEALGVTDRRVRQLIADGRIRARRVGHGWLVDGSSLPSRRHRGRPLSPTSADQLVHGGPVARPGRVRDRIDRLRSDPEPERLLASWLAARARRLEFTTREPLGVLADQRVVPGGVSDPRAGISAGEFAEGYVTAGELEAVRRSHLLRPATGVPDVVLHVAGELPGRPLPVMYLVADLAEHDGPRELARARELLSGELAS